MGTKISTQVTAQGCERENGHSTGEQQDGKLSSTSLGYSRCRYTHTSVLVGLRTHQTPYSSHLGEKLSQHLGLLGGH